MRPNCYECKHRRDCIGSAHSRCAHPEAGYDTGDPVMEAMAIFASVGRVKPIQGKTTLKIKAHPTGVRRGWFNWPFNFDPTWLLECDGYDAKD